MVGALTGFMAFSFLAGSLLGVTDPDQLAQSGIPVVAPEKTGQLGFVAILGLVVLGIAIWSITDAARTAARTSLSKAVPEPPRSSV